MSKVKYSGRFEGPHDALCAAFGRGARRRVLSGIVLLLIAACGAGSEPDFESESEAAPVLDESEYEGLTADEIRLQASPMTLEEAERLGIVDTTIRIEYPMDPDSVVPVPAEPDR